MVPADWTGCITRQCSRPAAELYDVFESRSCGRPLIGLTLSGPGQLCMVSNMYPARVEALLFELIAEVGLDIEESPYPEEFVLNPPLNVDDFTEAVLFASHGGQPVRPATS